MERTIAPVEVPPWLRIISHVRERKAECFNDFNNFAQLSFASLPQISIAFPQPCLFKRPFFSRASLRGRKAAIIFCCPLRVIKRGKGCAVQYWGNTLNPTSASFYQNFIQNKLKSADETLVWSQHNLQHNRIGHVAGSQQRPASRDRSGTILWVTNKPIIVSAIFCVIFFNCKPKVSAEDWTFHARTKRNVSDSSVATGNDGGWLDAFPAIKRFMGIRKFIG